MRKKLLLFGLVISILMCGCGTESGTDSNAVIESSSTIESTNTIESNIVVESEDASDKSETEDYGKTIKEETFNYDSGFMRMRCAEKSDGIHYYAYISESDLACASYIAVQLQNDGLIEKGIEVSISCGSILITRDYIFDSSTKEYNYDREAYLAEKTLEGEFAIMKVYSDQVTKDFFEFVGE